MLKIIVAFLCAVFLISATMMFATPARGEQRDSPCSFESIPVQPRPEFMTKCERDHDDWQKNCPLQPAV